MLKNKIITYTTAESDIKNDKLVVYATGESDIKNNKLVVYAIYNDEDLTVNYNYDAKRKILTDVNYNYDTEKAAIEKINSCFDSNIIKNNTVIFYGDSIVTKNNDVAYYYDAERKILSSIRVNYNYDAALRIDRTTLYDYDTVKINKVNIDYKGDAVLKYAVNIVNNCDAYKIIGKSIKYNFDNQTTYIKNIVYNYDVVVQTKQKYKINRNFDASILIKKNIVYSGDIERMVKTAFFVGHYDCKKITNNNISYFYDCVSCTVYVATSDNAGTTDAKSLTQSISIAINENTLADSFTLKTSYKLNINDIIKGNLLNFNYNYRVEETEEEYAGTIQTVKGCYDIDELLYTTFNYNCSDTASAKDHLNNIANAAGKNLVCLFDNFTPSNSYAGLGATYQNIVSGVFSWTTRLPHRQINVFIRDNKIYAIQRGHELESIDLTNADKSRPTISRKIMRSVWSSSETENSGGHSSGAHGGIISNYQPAPFSGTISYGDQSVTYNNGYIVSETHGSSTTKYDVSADGYVTSKTTRSGDTVAETKYKYATTLHDKFLATETETITNIKYGTVTVRNTRHVSVGDGWYYTSVEQDGELVGSNLSQGRTGGKASQYTKNQSNISLGSKTYGSNSNTDNTNSLKGESLIDLSFPVTGDAFLTELTKEIEWLNRKVQENITMDVYNLDKVIDFTQKIILDGNVYYLVSNTISRTAREFKQSINIVRWY